MYSSYCSIAESVVDKISRRPAKKVKTGEAKPKHVVVKSIQSPSTATIKEEAVSETSSSDDSDDVSSDEEEESPLPDARPNDPVEAVKYDTIKAVWLPRRTIAEASRIRNALAEYWEVVRTIRDRWKTDAAAVKTAEENKKASELPLLRDRVNSQVRMMETALKSAFQHGHPDVIRL
jgi:hypothetical protein